MSMDGPTVLVVDDVDANVRLLEAMLAPHGYDVLTAGDGEACRRPRTREETAVPSVVMLTSSLGGTCGEVGFDGRSDYDRRVRRPCRPG